MEVSKLRLAMGEGVRLLSIARRKSPPEARETEARCSRTGDRVRCTPRRGARVVSEPKGTGTATPPHSAQKKT